MSVIYKAGVYGNPSSEIRNAISIAERIYASFGKDLVITSLEDSTHMQGSLHYIGQAVDLRTSNLAGSQVAAVYQALRSQLAGYTVLLESDHIHIQFRASQPSKGTNPIIDVGNLATVNISAGNSTPITLNSTWLLVAVGVVAIILFTRN